MSDAAFITEPARNLPVRNTYDVVVVGGGIAGMAAAIAASRNGARTLLVEKMFMLGGLATAGLITFYLPICDGRGHQVCFGLSEELLHLSEQDGSEIDCPPAWRDPNSSVEERAGKRYERRFNACVYAIRAEQQLLREGVTLAYGTTVCGVSLKDKRISHVILEDKGGRFAVGVKNSVVDASGDSDVCVLAGAPTATFTEKNILAAWYYATEEGTNNLHLLGAADHIGSEKRVQTLDDSRFLGLDGEELTKVTVRAHRFALEDFLRKGSVTKEHALTAIATTPQVRMSRRIVGGYELDLADEGREFADSVGLFPNWRKRGPIYELPLRSLYSEKVPNLLVAGRNLSNTDPMWDISRVIPVCAVSGEAAGTAAAMTGDLRSLNVADLQAQLRSQGVKLHARELDWK